MIIQISYKRMWQVAVAFFLIISSWFTIGHFVWVKTEANTFEDRVVFDIKFLIPMEKSRTLQCLSLTSELPARKVMYHAEWKSLNTLRITVYEKEFPRGLKYRYNFKKAPALIPPFKVSAKGEIAHKLNPELLAVLPKNNVPTCGPVTLKFNTFIEPQSFDASVNWKGGCDFKPVYKQYPGGNYIDYSEWRAVPHKKLQNNHEYKIKVVKGLTAQNGQKLRENKELIFTTAPAIKFTKFYPEPNSPSVWVGRNILIETDQELKDAQITVKGVKGITQIKANSGIFIPERVFRPGNRYHVEAVLTSKYGEKIKANYSFHTVNLGNQKWLEVKLGKSCSVWVLEGDREIKKITAWTEQEPPRGTLYENSRGMANGTLKGFAPPWISLNADVLIHSLPESNDGIRDDHRYLGLPNAHACLYVNENDINWLYQNLTRGFMVIVH